MVSQPGRPLPNVPKYEEVTPRRGYQGEHWPNDLLQGDFDDDGYHYVTNTERQQGARKKHSFHSMSTVRLEEKLSDRMKLLENVRDQNVNNNVVDGAKSLHTPGRSDSVVGKNSSILAPPI